MWSSRNNISSNISLTEFRAHTDEILDTVIEGEETVIVTFADGRKLVLVPGTEWQGMSEPAYLTSTAANRVALEESLKEAAEGKTLELDL